MILALYQKVDILFSILEELLNSPFNKQFDDKAIRVLSKYGLEVVDGKIVKSQRRVSAEAKENGYGESEDEMIRKEIIAILQYKYEKFPKDPKYCNAPQWIAWLEKQKSEEINVKALLTADRLAAAEMTGRLKERKDIVDNPQKYGLEKQGKETNWKPSKEEMDVLYGLAYITNQYDEHKEEVITRLYQDLKREFFNGSSYENMFPNTEDDVRRRSTIQVLEYARSLDIYNQYGKADIDKNIAWLEKQAVNYDCNEDERIRRELIKVFSNREKYLINQSFGDITVSEALTWLEKQGGIDNCPLEGSADCVTTDSRKQGEQNHSEQVLEMVVKPKFNIGDWIVSDLEDVNEDFRLCKIIGIEDGCYTIQSANGCKGYNFFVIWESDFHLWSIADAKPGDVLDANGAPFIYKRHDEDYVYFYCGVNLAGEFIEANGIDTWNSINKVYPATKEQRDMLFQKMHEAGYTFDFEKKELKKIEQKPTEWSLPYGKNETAEKLIALAECLEMDGDCLFNELSGNDYGKFLRVLAKELTEVKPAEWSEEDDVMVHDILGCLPVKTRPEYNQRRVDWIKSIKSRVQSQPKQEWKQENREELTEFENAMMHIGGSFFGENAGLDPNDTDTIKEQAELLLQLATKTEWSEEDEKRINRISDFIWKNRKGDTDEIYQQEQDVDFLKSLKQKMGWKPSEKQIEALEDEVRNNKTVFRKKVLNELLEQLKKL